MSVSRQPLSFSAASTGAASGASIAAVDPVSRVVQQNAVIVLQAEEKLGLGRHGWLATPAWRRQASTAF